MHADGDGLYLQVTGSQARSWIFRYRWNGKHHEMGLGSLKAVSLADAREKALNAGDSSLTELIPSPPVRPNTHAGRSTKPAELPSFRSAIVAHGSFATEPTSARADQCPLYPQ